MYRSTTSFEKRKILTVEELSKELEQYRKLFNHDTFDYLNSLLMLNDNILCSGNVDMDFMAMLSKMDIYKNIASYNIYNKSLEILKREQETRNFKIEGDPNLNRINAYSIRDVSIGNISLFHYHFDHDGFHIGTFEIENNPTMRNLEIERLDCICASAYSANLRPSAFDYYEENLEKLLNFTGLSDFQKEQAKIQESIRNAILDSYGICLDEFTEQKEKTSCGYLNKQYVKKFPSVEFVHNIQYY